MIDTEPRTQERIKDACRELDSALKQFELVDTSKLKAKQEEELQILRQQIAEIKKQLEALT